MYPYSYFKAEGLSLEAVRMVQDAKETLEKIKDILRQKYNAADVFIGQGEPRPVVFLYTAKAQVPEGWAVKNIQMGADGITEKFVIVAPAYNTTDAFNVACISGLADRALKQESLSAVLQSPDFPLKNLPAGQYYTSFVRHKDVAVGTPHQQYDEMIGRLKDNVSPYKRSTVPIAVQDLLDYKKFQEDWYIRVPNDDKGQALYTPPDAVAVAYTDMRRVDENAYNEEAMRFVATAHSQRKKQGNGAP
jgi:hypothetical protein